MTFDELYDPDVSIRFGRFVVDGRAYCLSAGETLVMPARKPHSVHAEDAFKMLLTVVFPRNDSET